MPDLAPHHHDTTTRTISATSNVVPHETRHVATTRLTIANPAAQPDRPTQQPTYKSNTPSLQHVPGLPTNKCPSVIELLVFRLHLKMPSRELETHP